ncbi:MAG TPA: AAA family ATPase [Candidatus Dormibacteraeota bacterium]|jgi:predicted kinase|nr:AAA family ATPase [Candidatus Dormibacteraeota bacterium]
MTASLLLVNGAAGAGKSTQAALLARRLRMPVLDKDTIKEGMADVLGAPAREDSVRLGEASFAVILALARRHLDLGLGAILEAPFHGDVVDGIRPLVASARAALLQCDTDRRTLFNRVRLRGPSRHWVHFDAGYAELGPDDYRDWTSPDLAAAEPPDLGVPVLRVDTTSGYEPSIEAVEAWVGVRLLASGEAEEKPPRRL